MGDIRPVDPFSETYENQWNSEIASCKNILERGDRLLSENVKDAESFRGLITRLQSENLDSLTFQALGSLHPIIPHVRTSTTDFVEIHNGIVDASFTWGSLSLVVQFSLDVGGAIYRVAQMLKDIGHDLELFNEYRKVTINTGSFRETSMDVNIELVRFFSASAKCLRSGPFIDLEQDLWRPFTMRYNETKAKINSAFDRIDRLTRLSRSRAHIDELAHLQSILSLNDASSSTTTQLPCWILPSARNPKFYDRVDIFRTIDTCLEESPLPASEIASVALHGLGGVGKSSIALQYAHSKVERYPVVIWLRAETAVTLAQSTSSAVMELKLPQAKAQNHSENRVLLLNWLQKTSTKFLIIFDNAEDPKLLREYWPIGGMGAVIVTTRNHTLSFEPCGAGIEISTFAPHEGSVLLLHLLNRSQTADSTESAFELSKRLSGHALAIYQMAGLIQSRAWSIADFVKMYDKNAKRVHHVSHGGTSLGTVWQLSFDSLDREAARVLGVLVFLEPDSISQALFESEELQRSGKGISYHDDEWGFSEVLENLLNSALIKRNPDTRAFSVHRLVQTEFRYHLSTEDLQDAFNNSSIMLYEAFPKQQPGEPMHQQWPECSEYLEHVLALTELYKSYRKELPGFLPPIEFCQLLGNCARYLAEIGSMEVLLNLKDSAFDALDQCKSEDMYELTYAHVSNSLGVMNHFRGEFVASIHLLEKACEIRARLLPSDNGFVGETYSNLGNSNTSAGKLETGLLYHEKRRAFVSKLGPQPRAQNNLNLGFTLYLLEREEEFKDQIVAAVKLLEPLSNKWMLFSNALLQTGNDHRKRGEFAAAQENYEAARAQIVDIGKSRTHQMAGAYVYKLGAVALDQGDVDLAIKYLREALVICDFHKLILGDRARVLFKLSQALFQKNPSSDEAERKKKEAISLSKEMQKDAYVEHDQTEDDFDKLVCGLAR